MQSVQIDIATPQELEKNYLPYKIIYTTHVWERRQATTYSGHFVSHKLHLPIFHSLFLEFCIIKLNKERSKNCLHDLNRGLLVSKHGQTVSPIEVGKFGLSVLPVRVAELLKTKNYCARYTSS